MTEPYLLSISQRLLPESLERYSGLSRAEQVFVLVWELEAEVNNGGFSQFYFNSSGDRATETVAALRAIGADRTALIVERANARFASGPPADRAVRQEVLLEIDSNEGLFQDLDSEFYRYPNEISDLLMRFVREHRADIRGA